MSVSVNDTVSHTSRQFPLTSLVDGSREGGSLIAPEREKLPAGLFPGFEPHDTLVATTQNVSARSFLRNRRRLYTHWCPLCARPVPNNVLQLPLFVAMRG